MEATRSDLHAILQALTSRNVRFVVIGGVAMRLQGSADVTDDVDVCYARDADNLSSLVDALRPRHPRLRTVGADVPFLWDEKSLKAGLNFTLVTDLGALVILGEAPGVSSFEDLWQRASVMEVPQPASQGGRRVRPSSHEASGGSREEPHSHTRARGAGKAAGRVESRRKTAYSPLLVSSSRNSDSE